MKVRNPNAKFLDLIREGESERIEFKESFNREALETLCAFSNTKGGSLLIGVKDNGNIVGAQASQKAMGEWANQIDQGLGIHPSLEKKKIKGKDIALIQIKESQHKPILYRGRAYKRVGNSTRQMNAEELTRTILEGVGATWDELPEPRARISDIDPVKTKAFIRLANKVGRRPIPENTSVKKLLEKLGIIQKDKLTRAALLLFGKQPQKFYRQAVIKVGRFKSETLILDDREIEGTLLDQVEDTMAYFRERLQTRFEMTGKPQRDVIWEYPLEALREAVVNAVCHRDYMDSGHTQIRHYDDHLLIWNPGNLPDGLSVKMLKREHRSVPRNRLIAKVFFFAGLIEQWGSGVAKMISTTKASGLPEPIFEEKDGLRVVFRSTPHETPHVTPHETPHVEITLSPTEEAILKFCQKPRTRDEIIRMTDKNPDYIRKEVLPRLIRSGKLALTLPEKPRSRKQKYVTTA